MFATYTQRGCCAYKIGKNIFQTPKFATNSLWPISIKNIAVDDDIVRVSFTSDVLKASQISGCADRSLSILKTPACQ